MEKFKSMSPAARLESGQGLVIFGIQYGLYLSASIALTVATGVYLWDKETDNQCYGQNDSKAVLPGIPPTVDEDDWIDVSQRFSDILKIYFAVFVTETVRTALLLIAIIAKSSKLANVYSFGCFNDCLAFAALIILHVYRFQ